MAPVRSKTITAARSVRSNRHPGLSPNMINLLRGKNDSTWKRPAYRVKPLTTAIQTALVSSLEIISRRNPIPFMLLPEASCRALVETELYIKCKYSDWCDGRPVRRRDVTSWLKRQPFAQMINKLLGKDTTKSPTPTIKVQYPVRNETSNETRSLVQNSDQTASEAVESNAEVQTANVTTRSRNASLGVPAN